MMYSELLADPLVVIETGVSVVGVISAVTPIDVFVFKTSLAIVMVLLSHRKTLLFIFVSFDFFYFR